MLAKQLLRVPVNVPGHSGVLWVALFVICRGLVDKRGTGLLLGLVAGLLAQFAGFGHQGPFEWTKWLAAGAILELLTLVLPGDLRDCGKAAVVGAGLHLGKLAALTLAGLVLRVPVDPAAPRSRLVGHHARPVRRPGRPARRARAAGSCARSRSWTRRRGGRSAARRTHSACPRRRGSCRGVACAARLRGHPLNRRAGQAGEAVHLRGHPAALEIVDTAGDGQDLRLAVIAVERDQPHLGRSTAALTRIPRSIQVLSNGNLLFTDRNRGLIAEMTRSGGEVWTYSRADHPELGSRSPRSASCATAGSSP